MNKVLTISLNGNAYQLEEAAYEALRSYLDTARASLAEDPDVAEIMRDLEQAVADKLSACLGAHKSVASVSDIAKILEEMGPVNAAQSTDAQATEKADPGPKRLYRLTEHKMVFGVCAGVAAYLNVDVTIVRISAIALLLVTGGGFALAYGIAALFIPVATTVSEREAAHGSTPLTARDIVEGARKEYRAAMHEYRKWSTESSHEWRARAREEKRSRKEERQWWQHQGRAWHPREKHPYYRGPSAIGEVAQVLFLGLAIYLLYMYVPQTDPFFNQVWHLIHQGWSWLFEKISTSVS